MFRIPLVRSRRFCKRSEFDSSANGIWNLLELVPIPCQNRKSTEAL
jgi:hypothetical protein